MEITIGSTEVALSETDFEEFRSDLLNAYLQVLEEDEITTISEYLEKIPSIEENAASEIASQLEHDGLGLHVFFRSLPFNDQPFMFLMNNPKLDSNPHDFHRNKNRVEVYDLDDAYPDTNAMAAATANYLSTTLGGKWKNYTKTVISDICSATSWIDIDEGELDSYLQANIARDYERGDGDGIKPNNGFFEDFYYTNLHKIPTVEGSEVFYNSGQLAEITIPLEIRLADPDVVFVGGAKAWNSVYSNPDIELSPLSSKFDPADEKKIGHVHGQLFKSPERFFVPVLHPANRRNRHNNADQSNTLKSTLERLAADGVI